MDSRPSQYGFLTSRDFSTSYGRQPAGDCLINHVLRRLFRR